MTWKSLLALLLPASFRSDACSDFTRAASANIHASGRRRSASVKATLSADTRTASIETTNHRIEGRSGDRLTDHPRVGDAAYHVAEATREFLLRKPR